MTDQVDAANFYIVTLNYDYCDTAPYKNTIPDQWNYHKENTHVYYCSNNNVKVSTFRVLLKERKYTCVYINGLYSWRFSVLPLILANRLKLFPVIVSVRGMLEDSAVNVKGYKRSCF
ncbi:MAG: hypothetical protein HC896_01440 [Bacteroidales bacterium]|nr:hypothetical protein [Bacteroidales bacterium]